MRKWLYDCSAELIEDPLIFILTSSFFAALASIVLLVVRLFYWIVHGHWYRSFCDVLIYHHEARSACLDEDPTLAAMFTIWLDPSLLCLIVAIALLICGVCCIPLALFLGWLSERLGYRP
ncbi:hypothetical protein ACVIDN_003110 [Rhizobium brockwellii]